MRLSMPESPLDSGKKEGSVELGKDIKQFIDAYHNDMDDFDWNIPLALWLSPSRVSSHIYESVAETSKLWIKGRIFSISDLVVDTHISLRFDNASVASLRLSPQDSYRNHHPVTGRFVIIETEAFEEVLFMVIGATDVGSEEIHGCLCNSGAEVKRGEELGIFQVGDSSIIVAFENRRVEFDRDVVETSRQKIQVAVELGMGLR
ncbi:hypothetical protein MYCTH_2125560 [Thermothelomyces thermophilus ATCC 42464]|uniref:Phosphatidylserine decarboxylase n=1 Tax=Thermothelomyces thermophilus (strain ATCC 42464 / BCRC 31852 / DSM 1799) TaxID=573729 RepID=G2Q9W5_THET4|nr:uncharacterized protein MYCTH_2125560 [Thermothelomyces thermophilus ATCC 42464]AEO56574.1 hypothetical protein MYCTH_2125560 [Thermothelomyces thermophilus ATCC 42464]